MTHKSLFTHFRFLKILWKYCLVNRVYPDLLSSGPLSSSSSGTLFSILWYLYIHSTKSSQMFSTVSRTGDIIPHFLYGTDHMHRKVSPFTVNTDSVQNRQSFGLWTLFVNESVGGERSKIRTQTIKTTSARPSPKSRRGRLWGSCFGAEWKKLDRDEEWATGVALGNLSNVLTNGGRGPDTLSRLHDLLGSRWLLRA